MMSFDDYDELPARRTEGAVTVCVYGASDAALDRGLAASYEVYTERNVTPSRAAVCHQAVEAFELDPTLPEPDDDVRAAAAAYHDANAAALHAAGGSLDRGDYVEISQWPGGRQLWNTLPTLRAWRIKQNSPELDRPEPDEAPPGY